MHIAVTGTPGTGKTSVAAALSEEIGLPVVAVNDLIAGMDTETDAERGAAVVDPEHLRDAFAEADVPADAILEGHLAHHLPVDVAVVLRCRPDELEQRLDRKGWAEAKVQENVEAEALDIILGEAVDEQERVIEVDTTGKAPEDVAHQVATILKKNTFEEYAPGRVSWDLDDVFR